MWNHRPPLHTRICLVCWLSDPLVFLLRCSAAFLLPCLLLPSFPSSSILAGQNHSSVPASLSLAFSLSLPFTFLSAASRLSARSLASDRSRPKLKKKLKKKTGRKKNLLATCTTAHYCTAHYCLWAYIRRHSTLRYAYVFDIFKAPRASSLHKTPSSVVVVPHPPSLRSVS